MLNISLFWHDHSDISKKKKKKIQSRLKLLHKQISN